MVTIVWPVHGVCPASQWKQHLEEKLFKVHITAGLRHFFFCSLGKRQVKVIHVDYITFHRGLNFFGKCSLTGSTPPVYCNEERVLRFFLYQAKHHFAVIHWQQLFRYVLA